MLCSSTLRSVAITLALAASSSAPLGCGGEDAADDEDSSADEGDQGNDRDSGGPSRPDAGRPDSSGPSVPDSGRPGPDAAQSDDPRLNALAGRYLMRMDLLGRSTSQAPLIGDIVISSRVSQLQVAELVVDGKKLVATERVCTQVVEQDCREGCTRASSVVDPRVVTDFLLMREQRREYTLGEDGTLTAERITTPLGYDPGEDDGIPETSQDERVWDVVPGGDREGFLTKGTVTAGLELTCNVYGVQKFVSAFSGTLEGSEEAPAFPQMELDLEGSGGRRLGGDNDICNNQAVDSPTESANVRMVRYEGPLEGDDFWGCPDAAAFDEALAPTPLLP